MGARLDTHAHPPEKMATQESVSLVNQISIENKIKMENCDLILTAEVSICGAPVKFLIDSGAHATIINSKALKPNILYYPQIKYCITGINGPEKAVKTSGATYGNIWWYKTETADANRWQRHLSQL